MATFGTFMKTYRKTLYLSSTQLGEMVGCSASFISGIERGAQFPSTEMAKKILTELGVSYREVDSITLATDYGTFRFKSSLRGRNREPRGSTPDELAKSFEDLEKRVATLETLVLSLLSKEAEMR